ncbi:endonuclease/exonuclease/phosphatase family protein [Pontibacter sp. 172403-2]|uniref:endonuclease/exonuclease/phosphatase family protein n=1 Tax=Pontibacter rufus TaxID=2791028 RepID=UPI0018AFC49C|nr:endonuclease/exonuclease/phosphatase family protein [Pontibacter sp. 172403-2]MBF9255705.1 endonuclease/exonuclease/phosphatase family protein [Pontibacter sp. 172403-2]
MKKTITYCAFILAAFSMVTSCSEKTVSNASAASGKNQLRVMTYNIHHANPPSKAESGEIDLDAIANTIRNQNPDIVALQEVDVNTGRSGPVNQAEAIAEKLGMHAYFGRAIDYGGGYYGVAILSKYPLTETTVTHLPEEADPKAEDRVLTTAKITLPGGKAIRFGSTHLDVRSAGNRDQQVRTINDIAAKEKIPFIVAGDFNATPESSAIAELDKRFTRTCISDCAPTIPVNNPTRTIDFIAFTKDSPFQVVSQKVIPETYASDHLPVVVTLSY